jgi:hypothetical protein
MATIKTQNNRRNAANTGWDVIHQETSADIVLMDDGTNVTTHVIDTIKHVLYGTTTGAANSYVLTLSPVPTSLVDGFAICAKINVLNTGASTINVNGLGAKSILDSKGNAMTAGKLKANTPYTMRYNGTNFILQGEGASGDAIASDLRLGKTASTDAGDIVGTNTDKKWAYGSYSLVISGSTLGAITYSVPLNLDFTPSLIIIRIPGLRTGKATVGIFIKDGVAYSYDADEGSYYVYAHIINSFSDSSVNITSRVYGSGNGIYLTPGTYSIEFYAYI